MKTKNILIYSGLLLGGLFLGYLFFNGVSEPHSTEEHIAESHTDEEGNVIYTCSMHPQVRQNEPGNCPICGMELIPADDQNDSDSGSLGPNAVQFSKAALALAEIETTPVRTGTPEVENRLPGKVAVNQNLVSNVTAHFPGRIRELYVDYTGDYVRKGQKMASIYSPELITAQRELLETARFKAQNPRLYESARRKLLLWEFPEETIDQIERSGEVMEELDFFSPVSGYVSEINISREDHISEGSLLYRIAELSKVWVEFEAFESTLSDLKNGDVVDFTVSSIPGQTFSGTISFIQPFLDENSRSAEVRITAENPQNRMKPGMFAQGTISSKTDQQQQLLVPRSAVLWTGARSIVFVDVSTTDTPAFEAREVVLGKKAGNEYVIQSGLNAGERVVTNGTFKVDAAAQLSDKRSMMNREPGSGAVPVGHQHGGMNMDESEMNEEDHSNHQTGGPAESFEDVPDNFREMFTDAIEIYITGKDALVESDLAGAQSAYKNFHSKLEEIGIHGLSGDGHTAWMESYEELTRHASDIVSAGDLDAARTSFRNLSEELIRAVEMFGIEGVIYHQYCPMAFDNEGGDWMSREEQIQNPYLPESMPGCGEVIERIE